MAGKNDGKIRCSFCGKTQDQVNRLISGPNGAFICDECIDAFPKKARKKNGGLKARRTRSPFFCCTAVQKKLPAAGFHADAIKGEKFYELYCSVSKISSFHL